MESAAPRSSRWSGTRTAVLLAALLAAVVLAVHARALAAPYLWDDRDIVLRWPEELWQRSALLTGPFTGEGGYYRPLVTLSYFLDAQLFGREPAGLHLTNVILHAAVAVLVMQLARRFGAPALQAGLFAALWATLPRLTESVTWVAGRTDLLMTACSIGAFLLWPTSAAPARLWRWLSAWVLLGLALAAKETGLAALAAVVSLEWTGARSLQRRLVSTAALGVLALGYWLLRARALAGYDVDVEIPGAWQRCLSVIDGLGEAARALLDPLHPASILGVPGEFRASSLVLGAVAAPALAWLGVWVLKTGTAQTRAAYVLGALSLFAPLPWLPNPVNTSYADRFLYLPTAVGMAALAGSSAHWRSAAMRWSLPALGLLIAIQAWATNVRISDYQDPLRFWTAAVVDTDGRRTIPLRNLGAALQERLELEDAELVYRHTLELYAHGIDAFLDTTGLETDLASVLSLQGKQTEALRLRLQLAQRGPSPDAWLGVARVALFLRKFELAEGALSQPGVAGAPGEAPVRLALSTLRSGAHAGFWQATAPAVPLFELKRRALIAQSLSWRPAAIDSWRGIAQSSEATLGDVVQACALLCQVGEIVDLRSALARLAASWPAADARAALSSCASERASAHLAALESRRQWAPVVVRPAR